MTWVKVCGLRTPEDVEAARLAGADAIGLVLAPSPRQIDVETARTLARQTELLSVVVTVDVPPDALCEIARQVGAGGVQPHGRHAPEAAAAAHRAGWFVLHPLRVRDRAPDFGSIPAEHVPLLDAHQEDREGGTGVQFDWSLVPEITRPFVLAGGLGPDNVAEAVASVRPWGVDASSALESSPGIKDPARIRAFVRGAKQ